jgi:hypothetical protein
MTRPLGDVILDMITSAPPGVSLSKLMEALRIVAEGEGDD